MVFLAWPNANLFYQKNYSSKRKQRAGFHFDTLLWSSENPAAISG